MSTELFSHDPPPLETQSRSPSVFPGFVHPLYMSINSRQSCMMARFRDNTSGADMVTCIDRYLEENTDATEKHCIADLRTSNLNRLPASSLMELAVAFEFWLKEKNNGNTKLAIIATNSNTQDDTPKYHQLSTTNLQNVRLFSSIEDALDWIETPSE